jgi:large subunit ribosomal protein L15
MNLNDVNRGIQKHKKPKRVGRGIGSGHGKTSGRGHKGQGARAGWSRLSVFEGGQMPLVRRIPKRGFHNRFAVEVAIVNLSDLEKRFAAGEEVNLETLRGKNLCRGQFDVLKVLGNGALSKSLRVSAHRFSQSAMEKIRQAGGEVVVLPGKKPVVKNKQKAKGTRG